MALSWIGETKAKQILLISNCCHRSAAFQLLCPSTLQILLSKMYVWKSYNFIRQQFTHYKMFAVLQSVDIQLLTVWRPDCISLWNKWFPEMLRYGGRICERVSQMVCSLYPCQNLVLQPLYAGATYIAILLALDCYNLLLPNWILSCNCKQ